MPLTSNFRVARGCTPFALGLLVLLFASGGAGAQGASAADAPAADAPARNPAAGPAQAVVESLHKALIAAANDGPATREERYQALEPTILATHDLAYIAELTIRRQWRDLEDAQRHRFVAAFARLSIMTYATRFAAVGPEAFEIRGVDAAGDERLEVRAAIVRPGEDAVTLDYVLQEREGAWRIVNILADGVSDLALKRAQYQRLLGEGGTISDLIESLEAETERL